MGTFAYRGQQTRANLTWPSLSPVRRGEGWRVGGMIYIKMWFLQAGPSWMADPFMHVSCNANQFPHQRGSRKTQMFGVYFAYGILYMVCIMWMLRRNEWHLYQGKQLPFKNVIHNSLQALSKSTFHMQLSTQIVLFNIRQQTLQVVSSILP